MKTLSSNDIDRLLSACNGVREKLIIRTLLSTGIRASECCALTTADAIGPNGPRESLRLRVHKNMARHNGPQYVPMPNGLGIALAIYANGRPDNAPLFTNQNGDRLTRYTLYKTWARICQRAGVEAMPLHRTRHSFVSRLFDAGANIVTIRDMARHASIATTNRYAHVNPSAMAKAAKAVEV